MRGIDGLFLRCLVAERLGRMASRRLPCRHRGPHGYWALGGFWPGHNETSLARLVVGDRLAPAFHLAPRIG